MPRSHGCRTPMPGSGPYPLSRFIKEAEGVSLAFSATQLPEFPHFTMSRNEITSVPPVDEKDRDLVDHIEHDDEKNTSWTKNKHMDDAARILHEAGGHRDFTAEERRRVLRRIDLFVCVPMCITYFIQQVRLASPTWHTFAD